MNLRRLARTVASTATPTDPDTCRFVLNSEDARPISWGLIVEKVAVWLETIANAMPTPRRNMMPRIHQRFVSRPMSRKSAEVLAVTDHADHQHPSRPDVLVEPAGELHADHHADRLREGGQAGLEGRDAEQLLQQERQQEERADEPRAAHEDDQVALRNMRSPKRRRLSIGCGQPQLDDDEQDETDDPGEARTHDARRGPAVVGA